MVFSSLLFLFWFLPVVLVLYYLVPARWRNAIALTASLFFYAWGAPRFLFVLVASAAADYLMSHRMVRSGAPGSRARRGWLGAALTVNLSVFLYFKYANYAVGEFNRLLALLGGEAAAWTEVALPIGISFFTFQKMSYLVDTYRGVTAPARSFPTYLMYVVLFPQLIAGPIVRYLDIARQLTGRALLPERVLSGVWRFALGLAKKVLVANVLGEIADQAFAADAGALSAPQAWLGLLCYAFQIYCDFSGYSDMAIGLGRMLGFEFKENFNWPYLSRNFTEFWRRWHISLSTWMREYLYIPLGGNRRGNARTYLNLWIVFLLSGLWHGASSNFLLWGAFHGFFLSLDRRLKDTRWARLPVSVAVPLNFVLVLVSWVLFRADNLPQAWRYYGYLVGMGGASGAASALTLQPHALLALAVAAGFSFGPLLRLPAAPWLAWIRADSRPFPTTVRFVGAGLLFFLSACALTGQGYNPFIYFRF